MLAKTWTPRYSHFPCFVQPKFNGVRLLQEHDVYQSRYEQLWDDVFISHLRPEIEELRRLVPNLGPLDGELYHHGWRLQRINQAMAVNAKRRGPNEDTALIEYHIFDVVDLQRPFFERFADLLEMRDHLNFRYVKIAQTDYVHSSWEVDNLFSLHCAAGFEGVMLRPNVPYELGESLTTPGAERRSEALWKKKAWEDAEFRCVRVTAGEGKASIGIGALVCVTEDGHEFNVGTGYDDYDRVDLAQNPPIDKQIKVRFNTKTEDGIPVPASYICVMP